jgi:hypothetical protein
MVVANRLGVEQELLAESCEIIAPGTSRRGGEGLELRLHLRFANDRRVEAAHDFEEQAVRIGVNDSARRKRIERFLEKVNFAPTRFPRQRTRGRWNSDRAVYKTQAHPCILRTRGHVFVIALSDCPPLVTRVGPIRGGR